MIHMAKDQKNNQFFADFEKCVNKITSLRGKPLLVMFYSDPAGRMFPRDVGALEQVFDNFLIKKKKTRFRDLDLIIQTCGGEANTAYRLIQLIRSCCDNLTILIPTHAYSGGTLICFGADEIEMGRSATLSPIDVQLTPTSSEEKESFPLLSVEKYFDFLEDCSKVCKIKDEANKVRFLIEMTKCLIEEISASALGNLFRLRSLVESHAKIILCNYMFKNDSEKLKITDYIISKFTKESPTHQFEMDFELVSESSLKVKRMDSNIYILSKQLINMCSLLKRQGKICPFFPYSKKYRMPYFDIFDKKGG